MPSPLIKICGVTTPELARQSIHLGSNYIGIMAYPKSKRYVVPSVAKEIAKETKRAGGIPVAIFVDVDSKTMLAYCEQCQIDTIQLHGSLPRQEHHLLPSKFTRLYVQNVNSDGVIQPDADQGQHYLEKNRDILLYDHMDSGGGQAYPLKNFNPETHFRFFLAGGLNANNVGSIIDAIKPYGVDVSSGVESELGIKNEILIKKFIDTVRSC